MGKTSKSTKPTASEHVDGKPAVPTATVAAVAPQLQQPIATPATSQTSQTSQAPQSPVDFLPDQFDLKALFELSEGDVLQMESSPLMPTLSSEPLEAQVLSVSQETVCLRFTYYGVHLTTRTCKKQSTGFTWN